VERQQGRVGLDVRGGDAVLTMNVVTARTLDLTHSEIFEDQLRTIASEVAGREYLRFDVPRLATPVSSLGIYDVLPVLRRCGFDSFRIAQRADDHGSAATVPVLARRADGGEAVRAARPGRQLLARTGAVRKLQPLVVTSRSTEEAIGTAETTAALTAALQHLGLDPGVCDADDPDLEGMIERANPVVNGIHGLFGEDGELTSLCNKHGVSITGPPATVHQLCIDKAQFKSWATDQHVRAPRDLRDLDPADSAQRFVCKPRSSGGSVGLQLLDGLPPGIDPMDRSNGMLYEEYIDGRIVTCCLFPFLLGEPLPLLEVHSETQVYTLEQKRGSANVTYELFWPQTVGERHVSETSARLYEALGANGPLRFDWVIPRDGEAEPVILECNTNPGLRPGGNCGLMAAAAGVTFVELVAAVLLDTC
jgi:D-alanine-D-alanine ligase-like ATP-grasp enzyme